MRFDSLIQGLAEQNGRKKFIQQISITTTHAITTLATTDEYGIGFPPGSMLMLQGNVDFLYKFQPAGKTTAITGMAGAHPGVYVTANQQETAITHGDGGNNAGTWGPDLMLDLVAASTSGVVNVWLMS